MVSLSIPRHPGGLLAATGARRPFHPTYAQRETNQPTVFNYSNFGPKWTFDFMSHVIDNPARPRGSPSSVYLAAAAREIHNGIGGGSLDAPSGQPSGPRAHGHLSPSATSAASPDGAVEVFAQPDGAAAFAARTS